MEKLNAYGSLFMFALACFTYGGYVYGAINCDNVPEPHRWVLTGLFGIFFLINAIDKIKKL